MSKPNCRDCRHSEGIPGDSHLKCQHPATAQAHGDPMASMMAIFGSVGRVDPMIAMVPALSAIEKLGIRGNAHGVNNGWFIWPFNFDPTWLEQCRGFEKR